MSNPSRTQQARAFSLLDVAVVSRNGAFEGSGVRPERESQVVKRPALEFVWAVDPAVSRLGVAFAPVDGGDPHALTLRTDSESRDGQRLGWLDRQLRIAARQWAAEFPPACVWVEQPSGRHQALQLTYATGVVQAALFETLACPVWTMPSSTWKQRTVGTGNASKAQVLAWVARLGTDVGNQDEADAIALAVAGRAMLLSGSWEATA